MVCVTDIAGSASLLYDDTGCQDIIRFFQLYPNTTYTAAILQAPVSDREGASLSMTPDAIERTLAAASEQISRGKGHLPLPNDMLELIYGGGDQSVHSVTSTPAAKEDQKDDGKTGKTAAPEATETDSKSPPPPDIAPISANRWYSLTSTRKDGKEDYFSSDLPAEQYRAAFAPFRTTGRPLLMLYCGADEHVPKWVDKEALLARFVDAATEGEGKGNNAGQSVILDGADHGMSAPEVQKEFVERVCAFVQSL